MSRESFLTRAAERRREYYGGKQVPTPAGAATEAQRSAWQRYQRVIRPAREAACLECEHRADGGCSLLVHPGARCHGVYQRLLTYGHAHPDPDCLWHAIRASGATTEVSTRD